MSKLCVELPIVASSLSILDGQDVDQIERGNALRDGSWILINGHRHHKRTRTSALAKVIEKNRDTSVVGRAYNCRMWMFGLKSHGGLS
jgi:hypothetical protein